MKIVWIIIGVLGGVYAGFGVVQLSNAFKTDNPATGYGAGSLAAAVFPVCLGLIVCLFCFQKAFQKVRK